MFMNVFISEGLCKLYYGNRDFPPLANGVYFMVLLKKSPLEMAPLQSPFPKWEVSHAFE